MILLFSCTSFLILFCSFPRRMVVKRRKVELLSTLELQGGRGRSFKVWVWMIQPKSWRILCPTSNRIKRDKQSLLIRTIGFHSLYLTLLGLFPPESAIDRKGIQGWLKRVWEFSYFWHLPNLFHATSTKFVTNLFFLRLLSFLGHLYFCWN